MVPDLQRRIPGASVPEVVRDAAAGAARRRRPVDPLLLQRVRDALARLPDGPRKRGYIEIPGDCLASPRGPQQA